jgi:AcrR family transcriptional regulator
MGSETRRLIVREAALLFHEQGYAATSISEILEAADAGSGSLYHFFPSKTELLEAVLEYHLELLAPSLLDVVEAETADPIGRVFALLALYRGVLADSNTRLGCPVGALALEVSGLAPRIRSLIDRYFAEWLARLRRWLDDAGARLPADLDRQALGRLVLAVLQGAIVQARATASLEAFDASLAALRNHFELLEGRPPMVAPSPAAPEAEPPAIEEDEDEPGWRSW